MNLQPKIVDQVKQEKEQEQKKLIRTKYRKGLTLFGLDPDTMNVYEVKVEEEKVAVFGEEPIVKRNAKVNPAHKYIWAMNEKNAHRKFGNMIKKLILSANK